MELTPTTVAVPEEPLPPETAAISVAEDTVNGSQAVASEQIAVRDVESGVKDGHAAPETPPKCFCGRSLRFWVRRPATCSLHIILDELMCTVSNSASRCTGSTRGAPWGCLHAWAASTDR